MIKQIQLVAGIITIKMKHLDIHDILNKRKQTHPTQPPPPTQPSSTDLLDKLQDILKTNSALHLDTKVEILHLIADKTGTVLNKSIVAPYLTLLQCHQIRDLTVQLLKGESFYVLNGQVREYCLAEGAQGIKFNTQPLLSYSQQSEAEDDTFQILAEFQLSNPTYTFSREVSPTSGIGKIFKEKPEKYSNFKVVGCQGALLVVFAKIDRQDEFIYGWGLNQEEKLELVKYFPVLTLLGKKLANFINNFHLKQFNFKDLIYKKGQSPCSVYFVIEGEVNFELVLDDHPEHKKITTSTITANNYFGEEEIIFKGTTRSHTAKVITSKCTVLELSRDKFQKLMENNQFAELVIKTAKIKELERHRNIQKARKILIREREPEQEDILLTEEEVRRNSVNYRTENKRRFSSFRANNQKVKIMHGNIIKEVPSVKGRVEFSMLHVNPDHYAATKDKYRQYMVKKSQEKAKKPWDFRKLWKVLNLEDVLSQNQMDLGSTEGRRFFDSHRRLQHQLLQSKSVRPKTTSSNYRTKMQYIAYLQQFNQ